MEEEEEEVRWEEADRRLPPCTACIRGHGLHPRDDAAARAAAEALSHITDRFCKPQTPFALNFTPCCQSHRGRRRISRTF